MDASSRGPSTAGRAGWLAEGLGDGECDPPGFVDGECDGVGLGEVSGPSPTEVIAPS